MEDQRPPAARSGHLPALRVPRQRWPRHVTGQCRELTCCAKSREIATKIAAFRTFPLNFLPLCHLPQCRSPEASRAARTGLRRHFCALVGSGPSGNACCTAAKAAGRTLSVLASLPDELESSIALRSMPRLKVLVSAYACEPHKGSEAEIGWNWARQAARYHDVWVITRASNRAAIEAQVALGQLTNVSWVYYDLPRWLRGWKRQRRGLYVYYLIWQSAVYWIARSLHQTHRFDLVHHVTFGTYWLPTFLGRLGLPFIWGPVGGGESGPASFRSTLSLRGRSVEQLRSVVRWCAERTPLLRAVARSVDLAFATTEESAAALRRMGASRVRVLSHVALPREDRVRLARLPLRNERPFRIVSIGHLIAWKGLHLSLAAFARLVAAVPDCEYWIVGDGPERLRLERLASRLGVPGNVRFVGSVPRTTVMQILSACDVLVHPSLHDSGGYACVEAMACGRPVVCLDLGGPAALVDSECGIRIPANNPEQTKREIAAALRALAEDPAHRARLGAGARRVVAARCDWDKVGDFVYGDYAYSLARPGSDAA